MNGPASGWNDNRRAPFEDVLKTLIRVPSVVGAEHSFFRELQRELETRGAKVTWYEGLLVAEGSNPTSAMFSAHIDRHGLVCTGPNEFQYAAFVAGSRSDLLGNSVSEELMLKIVDRFAGADVYAYEPWSGVYRGTGTIRRASICEFRNNLIFEIGGLEHLIAGTPVAFSDRLRVQDDCYVGQLDNVLGTAALVYLFELGFQGTAFFTAQEEAGRSWRYLLEWFRRFGGSTNQLIAIDTSPYATDKDAQAQNIVLRRRDANASFNKGLSAQIGSMCNDAGIAYSYKDEFVDRLNAIREANGEKPLSLGSTEMGRIIAASNGLVDGTTVQVPTTGYHTMSETVSIAACRDLVDTLCSIADRRT